MDAYEESVQKLHDAGGWIPAGQQNRSTPMNWNKKDVKDRLNIYRAQNLIREITLHNSTTAEITTALQNLQNGITILRFTQPRPIHRTHNTKIYPFLQTLVLEKTIPIPAVPSMIIVYDMLSTALLRKKHYFEQPSLTNFLRCIPEILSETHPDTSIKYFFDHTQNYQKIMDALYKNHERAPERHIKINDLEEANEQLYTYFMNLFFDTIAN